MPAGFFGGGGAIPAQIATNLVPVYGRTPANLRRWLAALAKLRAGVAYRPLVLFIGDSKTFGAGAGSGPASGASYINGAAALNKPAWLVKLLNRAGIPASRQSFMGTGVMATVAQYQAYDPRLSGMDAWGGGSVSVGGPMWASGNTNPLSFLPDDGPTDTLDVYTKMDTSNAGPWNVTANADAAILAAITGTGGVGIKKTTVSLARAVNTWKLSRPNGAFSSLMGLVAKDSTIPAVDVVTAGAYGTKAGYAVSPDNAFNCLNALAALAPDLVCIQLGTNDIGTGGSIADALAAITILAAKAKATGASVVIEIPTFGVDSANNTLARREELRRGLIALALANGYMCLDHDARFGSYAIANGLGLHRDGVPHEMSAGYADEAQALLSALLF